MTPRLAPDHLSIGITCFPTYGGSGIIATEIGLAMARRGHRVHFICSDVPKRLERREQNVLFHGVEVSDYPLFRQGAPYGVALASKIVEVAQWDPEGLDVLHVHYAVPHATSAYLAAQVLGERAPKIVTTLHGTDITLVGRDPSFLPITRFSIQQSDAVSVPSEFLRDDTCRLLNVEPPNGIEVIPNFVDEQRFRPAPARDREPIDDLFDCKGPNCWPDETITLVHVSNFRPVKRVLDVVEVFARVASEAPARLVLIGDGPDRSTAEQRLRALGLYDRAVCLGKQRSFVDVLQQADVFLLPSQTESFGLAALEAQACGVPVVASQVGGLPEVITHDETGLLCPVGDVGAMAQAVLSLARAPARRLEMGRAARQRVLERFRHGPLIDRYEALYRRVLGRD